MNELRQSPAPGSARLAFCGESIEVSLHVPVAWQGEAFLRTNLGYADVRRREIIAEIELGQPRLDTDWHDLPMERVSSSEFVFSAELFEPGIFEAKAFFADADGDHLHWPDGDNIQIKVEPASLAAANTIYTAFVRQFGPNKDGSADPGEQALVERLDARGYTVIPASGRFRDLIPQLDLIIREMGFRFIQLLPIHPVPTTYARMGRFGSPFAALDFMNVDQGLADFDECTTPLEQFLELVQEIHLREGSVILDIALNHTGWASQLQIHHPEWFVRNADGSFRSPGAWGVVWEDLSELDYSKRDLWRYVADVLLYWCGNGVDGFRCDAGYMIPFEVWEYVIAKVRSVYPETLFLLEGLGGRVSTTRSLLGGAGLDWAYSEIFQNYDRDQLESYLPASFAIEHSQGLLVNFAETHDNNRLAARGRAYARMRTALCALLSQSGTFGITNGVEWYAEQKLDVHGAASLNWDNPDNLIPWLSRINRILAAHPAFQAGSTRRLIEEGAGNSLAVLRESADKSSRVVILANLSDQSREPVKWSMPDRFHATPLSDLLTGEEISVDLHDGTASYELAQGEIRCLSSDARVDFENDSPTPFAPVLQEWRCRARISELRAASCRAGAETRTGSATDARALFLSKPGLFIDSMVPGRSPAHVEFRIPRDFSRVVMVPPGLFLLVRGDIPFSVTELKDGHAFFHERSLNDSDGGHFAVLPPITVEGPAETRRLRFHLFKQVKSGPDIRDADIMRLPPYSACRIKTDWTRSEIEDPHLCALLANRESTVSYVRADWASINSQYDAILAVNPNPSFPGDRVVTWTRCRCWVVCKDYSREIGFENLYRFSGGSDQDPCWRFLLPVGRGRAVPFRIELSLASQQSSARLRLLREDDEISAADMPHKELPAGEKIRLVVRPDIEERSFHAKTKAFMGAEEVFGRSIVASEDGFAFRPGGIALRMHTDKGRFVHEPEWNYMIEHPLEAERGLEQNSDLFSPGYFTAELDRNEMVDILAEAIPDEEDTGTLESRPEFQDRSPSADCLDLRAAAARSIPAYIARRNRGHTVIAGYPWFLDWGRDTLIALRGIIAGGWSELALEILIEFARFESDGTLPNMIHGDDASNRDTSDAPLWFFVACRDLIAATGGDKSLFDKDCGKGRKIADVLTSICENYASGTPNGIGMDQESGLIFSPEHFTWMDTQHPAGTPRCGYPIEIQALWVAALGLMAQVPGTDQTRWKELRGRVVESIRRLYPLPGGGLSDCLHAVESGISAAAAEPDDHCRPNQLLAITLGEILDQDTSVSVVNACWPLLVPGAIRSLDDAPVSYHLPVSNAVDGSLLNDPSRPYWGQYRGDEDTSRKPAYHNGTAWVWQFPLFSEALFIVYGEVARDTALALLGSTATLFEQGCAGHLPEILDGDAPHRQRGCTAQAWSACELLRVIERLG